MPVRCEIQSADGVILKVEELWPRMPLEVNYIGDYFRHELGRIIGLECLFSDLGGVVHVVDDPKIIAAVNHGRDISTVFGSVTAAIELPPEDRPVELPFTTKNGYLGKALVGHVLPPPAVLL